MNKDQITELFDKQGNLIGALLTAEGWNAIKPLLGETFSAQPIAPPRITRTPVRLGCA